MLTVNVNVIQTGKLYLALTRLGGLTIRGRSADNEASAIKNLFYVLAGMSDNDDADVGLSLALSGQDINQVAITDGSGQTT